MFVMGEVAQQLFQESPTAFLSEMRNCKHARTCTTDNDVLAAIAELRLPVEVAATPSQVGGGTGRPPSSTGHAADCLALGVALIRTTPGARALTTRAANGADSNARLCASTRGAAAATLPHACCLRARP
jgi:hypothetical protein